MATKEELIAALRDQMKEPDITRVHFDDLNDRVKILQMTGD